MDHVERLAQAVVRAVEIRENSWRSAGGPIGDYTVTLRSAADKAAEEMGFDERMTEPLYYLLAGTWNDALDWANKVLNEGTKDATQD